MRILLYHWHEAEVNERAAELRARGHEVSPQFRGQGLPMKAVDAFAPELVVIDLRRLPSHGREIAIALRGRKNTSAVPLLFVVPDPAVGETVRGDPDRGERLREDFPDATFCSWSRIASALRAARGQSPATPSGAPRVAVPAVCSTKPLAAKLGVKPDTALLLLGAPGGFQAVLGELPRGVRVFAGPRGSAATIVLFAPRRAVLAKELPAAVERLEARGALWVAWPKRSSGVATDLAEDGVRELAAANGLVDVKVCAIDATWSGLCLRRRAAR